MKEYLFKLLDNSNALSLDAIVLNMAVAIAIGFVIFLSYALSHTGTIYSKKFNVSLVMLTILTATVMSIIGNNVALSLGMVGALSIVRYRTAIKDSRDTAYIFWAIIGGIACGAGDYMIGAIGTAAVFLVLILLGRIKNDDRLLIIIRGTLALEHEIEALLFTSFQKRARLRVKNTTKNSVEFIYEISRTQYDKANASPITFINKIYALGEIEYINIVTQNDEIV